MQRFVLSDLLTNGYLIWDAARNAVMIDAGGGVKQLLAFIAREKLALRAILCTHGHADHTQANVPLREATGAPIGIHPADAPFLQDTLLNAAAFFQWEYQPHRPGFLLEDGQTLDYGELAIRVIHTPGHTPGSCCFLVEGANVLFAGDLVFAGSVGRHDTPGGDGRQMAASLRRFCELDDAVIVHSGHGNETTVGEEKRTNPFIREALAGRDL